MAKISTYVIDGSIVDGDKVIGSDANNDMVTKNYTVGDLVTYFAASIGGNYLVPYIGANDDVDLGSFNITANDLITTNSIFAGGTEGLANQVLTSQGPGLPTIWSYNSGNQTLQSVLSYGNTANNSITLANASYSINLDQTTGAIALADLVNSRIGYINTSTVHLVGATSVADYYHNGVVYTSGGNTISVLTNVFNNQTIRYPSAGGVLVLSVNGVSADITGNITIPIGPTTTPTLQDVTDQGNTTTNPILITDYLSIEDPASSNTGVINSAGLLSASRDYNLPDADGTFVLSVNGTFADAQGNINITSGGVSGSGTTNYIPKWSGATSLSDSLIVDNGTSIAFSTWFTFDTYSIGGSFSRLSSNSAMLLSSPHVGERVNVGTIGGNTALGTTELNLILGDVSNTSGVKDGFGFTGRMLHASGSGVVNIFNIDPVFQQSGGTATIRGFYYNPSFSIPLQGTNIAFENTSGDIVHGNLGGGGTQMVVADNTGKLGVQAIPTSGGLLHGTASGTDTYAVTISGVASYADGDAYLIRFTNGNTTGCTLNINGLGAIMLYRNNDGPLLGGDIWDGAEMLCVYNSTLTAFQCIGTSPNAMYAYVTNDDSVTITKGQVVYAFGGTGDRMTVKLANNTGDATSAQTVGVVLSTSIAANQKGIIITQGLLDGLSILPTATYNDGDPLYLGATAGAITNVKPYAPNHLVYLGNVTTASNGSAGRWYVRVQNGYELDELHNVQAQSPVVNDILYYFGGSPGQWKTASISTILGYTPQADTAWVDCSTNAISGWSVTTTKKMQYKLLGNSTMIFQFQIIGTGTGSTSSLTLPFSASSWGSQEFIIRVRNSTYAAGLASVAASSATLNVYPTPTAGNFTTGAAREVSGCITINL